MSAMRSFLACLWLGGALSTGLVTASEPLTFALVDLKTPEDVSWKVAAAWQDFLLKQFQEHKEWKVLSFEDVSQAVADNPLENANQASQLGLTLNADFVIYGSLMPVGGSSGSAEAKYVLTVHVVDSRHPALANRNGEMGTLASLQKKFPEFSKDMMAAVQRLVEQRKKLDGPIVGDRPGITDRLDQPLVIDRPGLQERLTAKTIKELGAEEVKAPETTYRVWIGLLGAYNALLTGYQSYDNGLSGGMEVRWDSYEQERRGLFGFTVTAEEQPLNVPAGTNGTSEDLISLQVAMTFHLLHDFPGRPYFGAGLGVYGDWTRVNTPASGSLSTITTLLGLSPRFGLEFDAGRFRIIPEVRYHRLFSPARGANSVSHLGAGVSVLMSW